MGSTSRNLGSDGSRMAVGRRKPTASLRIAVSIRSHGRCEFLNCNKIVARLSDGEIITSGEYAHILPIGVVAPRSEYKENFDVPLDSPENIILLCEEHHTLVDRLRPENYPPAVLFAMAAKKSEFLDAGIDEFMAANPLHIDLDVLKAETRLCRIVDLVNHAQLAGPKDGRGYLNTAAATLRDIKNNPFITIEPDILSLLDFEISTRRLQNTYNTDHWQRALQDAERVLNRIKGSSQLGAALLLAMTFVRDEYNVFPPETRLRFIKFLQAKCDILIKGSREPSFAAFLLSVNSALLRWRGRLQRGALQRSSYAEAERSIQKSLATARSCAASLQQCLIKYTQARALSMKESAAYESQIGATIAILLSNGLADYR
jgi:hypothetical protein